jgi:exodeoxyribonuclease VIII
LLNKGAKFPFKEFTLEDKDYRALESLCYSEMKYLLQSPAHYRFYKDNPQPASKAMLTGRAVHMAILEPHLFKEKYACLDDSQIIAEIGGANPRATKVYKEWLAAFRSENSEREVLVIDEYVNILNMSEAVYSHKSAGQLLNTEGRCELSLFWVDKETDVPMKSRLDKLLVTNRIIDIKTCESASLKDFERSIYNYGYYLQAAVYSEAFKAVYNLDLLPFTFICIESKPPYAVAVYELDEQALMLGQVVMRKCINLYKECKEFNDWPSYSQEIKPISVPQWALKEVSYAV